MEDDDSPVRIFVSYAHEDEAWREALFRNAIDTPDGVHPAWTDDRIEPGSIWDDAIDQALQQATVAILLVSRHFLESVYISRKELPALLHRRLSDGLKLLWVPIGPLDALGDHALASIQAAHSLGRPLPARPRGASEAVDKIARQVRYEIQAAIDPVGVPLMRELAGRFEPFSTIARTELVAVYRSRDRNLRRVVAIKVLRSPGKAEQFAQAVRDAAVVADEPHFVKMYDAVLAGPQAYCVMQFVDGQSLRRWIDADPRRPFSVVIRILSQVTRALVSAHALGVGYGNLRPSNVILSRDNKAFVQPMGLRVNEFRGHRLLDELATRSPDAEMMSYLAPEQFDERMETVSAELTDQYMLGLLAFELITGAMPPTVLGRSATVASLADLRREGRAAFTALPRATALRPDCSEVVATLIERMTSMRPQDRYPNLKELLIDMRRQEDIALARARESLDRCLAQQAATGRGFAQAVYSSLFERRPDARGAFADIGPSQYAILENAVVELFAFYEQERGRVPREPNVLTHMARTHDRGHRAIALDLYAPFTDALVSAACGSALAPALDPKCALDADEARSIEAAWRDVLRPGVEYMMRRY
jgi:hypothetical protein